jgi:membrane associated rhomboid family serine protease
MSLTLVILVLTIGISLYANQNPDLKYKWVMNPVQITRHREYYRFLLSGFIHADLMHLLFNMFSLFFVGDYIEQIFQYFFGVNGQLFYAALYLLGIIVSDLPSYFKHKTNSNYNSLGASGGVSALMFAFVLLAPMQDICLYGILCMPGFVFGILYLVYSFYEAKRGISYVNHSAHLTGALFGVVFTGLVIPEAVPMFFQQIATIFN